MGEEKTENRVLSEWWMNKQSGMRQMREMGPVNGFCRHRGLVLSGHKLD